MPVLLLRSVWLLSSSVCGHTAAGLISRLAGRIGNYPLPASGFLLKDISPLAGYYRLSFKCRPVPFQQEAPLPRPVVSHTPPPAFNFRRQGNWKLGECYLRRRGNVPGGCLMEKPICKRAFWFLFFCRSECGFKKP